MLRRTEVETDETTIIGDVGEADGSKVGDAVGKPEGEAEGETDDGAKEGGLVKTQIFDSFQHVLPSRQSVSRLQLAPTLH